MSAAIALRLAPRPEPAFVPSGLFPNTPGERSIITLSVGSSVELIRINCIASALNCGEPNAGGAPTSDAPYGVPAVRVTANGVTPPHCGVRNDCVRGTLLTRIVSGCHVPGLAIVVPD